MVITFINIKGGVGKTTSIVNIAACLGVLGKKILMIDSDPNCSATSYFGLKSQSLREGKTLVKLCDDVDCKIDDLIMKTKYQNIDMICCTGEFNNFNSERDYYIFDDFIEPVRNKYDYILIDTHGSVDAIFYNAVCAADTYFLPLFAEADGFDGFQFMNRTVSRIQRKMNRKLKCHGILVTNYSKKSGTNRELLEYIMQACEAFDLNFVGCVPAGETVKSSALHSTPLIHYRSTRPSPARDIYKDIAHKISQNLITPTEVYAAESFIEQVSHKANSLDQGAHHA